jgi:BioD-like phosphotransacetylase family protein
LLERKGDDAHAQADAAAFAAAATQGDHRIVELPAGDVTAVLKENAGARVVIVATPESAGEASTMARNIGEALTGVILNRVPVRGPSATADTGIAPIAVVTEDRTLASPSLGDVAWALNAETENLEANSSRVLDRLVIASIAADPGQAYFDRTRADSVIVRSDKPDLQLAALNAGAECLIITGGLPVLHYVLERVAEDEVPLLRTGLDTKDTVAAIERLYGMRPFAGEPEKLRRVSELFAGFDVSRFANDGHRA